MRFIFVIVDIYQRKIYLPISQTKTAESPPYITDLLGTFLDGRK